MYRTLRLIPGALILLTALMVGCKGSSSRSDAGTTWVDADTLMQLAPTEPLPLGVGHEDEQDEDPTILISQSGEFYAAWYSNRLGNRPDGRLRKEIFLTHSVDGNTWDNPIQVTSSYEWNFYPSLAQSPDSTFRMAWMRWYLLPFGCSGDTATCGATSNCCTGIDHRICYLQSANGITWKPSEEIELTTGPDDQLPIVVLPADGRELVYFVSGVRGGDLVLRIYVLVHDNLGWHSPVAIHDVNSTAFHNTFPHVIETSPNQFVMTWTRYAVSEGGNLFNMTTDTMTSTSTDGLHWSTPQKMSDNGNAIDVFPYIYTDASRQHAYVAWVTSNDASTSQTIDMPIEGTFPTDIRVLDISGYTPRIVATRTPDIYWATWVSGTEPTQKITSRFFRR